MGPQASQAFCNTLDFRRSLYSMIVHTDLFHVKLGTVEGSFGPIVLEEIHQCMYTITLSLDAGQVPPCKGICHIDRHSSLNQTLLLCFNRIDTSEMRVEYLFEIAVIDLINSKIFVDDF